MPLGATGINQRAESYSASESSLPSPRRRMSATSMFTPLIDGIGVPVAAGVLYPVLGLLVSPMWASAAMTLSSLSVISNALRLRHVEL